MKTIKKINLGKPITEVQMDSLLGGSNVNEADYCKCSGNTQGWPWCGDNKNTMSGCACNGNDGNSNSSTGCSCGSP